MWPRNAGPTHQGALLHEVCQDQDLGLLPLGTIVLSSCSFPVQGHGVSLHVHGMVDAH